MLQGYRALAKSPNAVSIARQLLRGRMVVDGRRRAARQLTHVIGSIQLLMQACRSDWGKIDIYSCMEFRQQTV